MRAVYLALAATFCLVAIVVQLIDGSPKMAGSDFLAYANFLAVVSLLAAGIFLVLGLKSTAAVSQPETITLDEKKKAILQPMLDRGDEGAAVRQVQMWFRGSTPETAREAVQELKE
ncbi:hypothetical protein CATRI_09685 [Corynebacterium atrinae]|uniref:hypothetical protein n=1 Tax=Corynebacterium atrinae TaxID=1336740 RepID=UPI0025B545BA|nr:hypothetical protein [Corynebacterium atrinae]WJY64005.1 hypothetical protein CATRI_09685 [Corynebacterium atrinae]